MKRLEGIVDNELWAVEVREIDGRVEVFTSQTEGFTNPKRAPSSFAAAQMTPFQARELAVALQIYARQAERTAA